MLTCRLAGSRVLFGHALLFFLFLFRAVELQTHWEYSKEIKPTIPNKNNRNPRATKSKSKYHTVHNQHKWAFFPTMDFYACKNWFELDKHSGTRNNNLLPRKELHTRLKKVRDSIQDGKAEERRSRREWVGIWLRHWFLICVCLCKPCK